MSVESHVYPYSRHRNGGLVLVLYVHDPQSVAYYLKHMTKGA